MTPERMAVEYKKSIAVYERLISRMRARPRLTRDEKRKLYQIEEALADMRYALGVMTHDIKEERIGLHEWEVNRGGRADAQL